MELFAQKIESRWMLLRYVVRNAFMLEKIVTQNVNFLSESMRLYGSFCWTFATTNNEWGRKCSAYYNWGFSYKSLFRAVARKKSSSTIHGLWPLYVTKCYLFPFCLLSISNAKITLQGQCYNTKVCHYVSHMQLRRYEEVIHLCKQSLEAAVKNSTSLIADGQSSNLDSSEILKSYYFLIWRYCLISKSYFCLGKLEKALDFLDKQEHWRSMVDK